MKIKAVINMKCYRIIRAIPLILAVLVLGISNLQAQNRDNLPREFREYTNPEEVVNFDRTISFDRALDVINDYAQKYRNKIVINRTDVSGPIGISVPKMHWMDALKLILKVKNLALLEQKDIFEIVRPQTQQPQARAQGGGGGSGEGEGPVATTKTHEVRIKAIFFEGNRRALQEIGVDWSTLSENVPQSILNEGGIGQSGGGQSGGQSGQQSTPRLPQSDFNGPFVQVNSKGAQSVSQDVFNAIVNVGEIGNTGIEVQALFSAFEADNLGEILASPTIKVMDGQQGRIQVGQDFSIKQRDIAGNVIEDFFSVGTILEVTPQVIDQEDTTFIHLDIDAQRSTAQPDPVSTIINKQQAQTQALLLDGEATVIAGLYNTETSEVRRGVPILKDLPAWFFGLRYLFGYTSKDFQTRELVILLQAELEPTIPQRYDNKDDLKGKYEVLQDERDRMHEEMKRGQEVLTRNPVEDKEGIQEDEDMEETSEQDTMKVEPQNEDNREEQPAEMNEEEKPQPVSRQNEQKEEEPTISDPEVKTQKITLDLGGPEEDSTAQEEGNQSAMQADNSNDEENQAAQTEQMQTQQNSTQRYFLIAGSFKVQENANDYRDKLQQQGYEPVILDKKDSDIMFVAYRGYSNIDAAKAGLTKLQQDTNPNAWLYIAK